MSIEQSGATAPSLIDRAKAIILQPKAEWEKIAAEPADAGKLIGGYLVPLAALSAIAFAIGASVFGYGGFGFSVRLGLTTVIGMAVTQVVMAIVGALVLAWIVNALAPSFGSTQDMGQAQKLVVYSWTASFLAGLFAIYPPLGMLSILGLYSLALLYMGMPPLMKTPLDKRVGYFIATIIAAIVIFVIIGAAMGAVRGALGGPLGGPFGSGFSMNGPGGASVEGKVTLPGGGSIDLGAVQKSARDMRDAQVAAGQGMAGVAGQGEASTIVDPAKLQELLPQALPGGFTRISVSSDAGGAAGMQVASAEGVYKRGDAELQVNVIDMGAMGAMASMAGALGVNANHQDANGYERAATINGRLVTETVDNGARTAKYAIVGKSGASVTVDASGGASIEDAKAALNAVGIERLEALTGK
jgi:hypothetical protein